LDVDVSTRSAEAAESQIDAFISRMDTKRRDTEGERLEEELYAESVRRFHERQRQENRARWFTFHSDMSELHRRLSEEHQEKAERLCEDEQTNGTNGRREAK
jgi:type VI protein secretion system component VasK